MALPLGLIRKTPAAATGTPTTPAAAPRLPSQGHTQDDDEGNIPPPPAMPNGTYLCRVKNVYHPINKETGLWEKWDDGSRKQSKVFFIIDDPDEQRKATAGKENCYGADLDIKLDFGSFYNQTLGYLTALGCPQMTWPKNEKGKTNNIMLGEHIMAQTKGKKFAVTVKPEAGKGDKKTTLYKNVKKVVPHTPPKAPPKPAAKSIADEVADHLTDLGVLAEESTGADPDTSTTSNAESDGIPF